MEELDLKNLFNMFWNKKLQIILIVLIFFVLGIIYTNSFVTPKYTSSTTLVLASSGSGEKLGETTNSITATDITVNSKLVSTYSELVKSKNVLRQVISNLNININENDLRNNVAVSSVKNTELIEISVTSENASYAAKIANEIAKVFSQKVGEIYNINNVHIVDTAEISQTPSNINKTKNITIFVIIGLVVALVYVLIANMLDTTIKTAEDIDQITKLPVLASIPVYNSEKGGKN